jgi:hypothetical protein
MRYRKRRSGRLPLMAAELALASWEVVARRGLMIAQNRCTPREYQRMVAEKVRAARASATTLMASGGRASLGAMLAPWHRRAKANARRLRRR